MPTNLIESLQLDARIVEQTEKSLQIEWTLVNGSKDTLVVLRYLFRSFDSEGRLNVEPNLTYVTISEDGAIEVAKKLLRVPERGIHVLTPFVPLGVELTAGETMAEKITLSLPLIPWDPYHALIQLHRGYRAMQKVESKQLQFHLGVYRKTPEVKSTPVETALGQLIYPYYDDVLDAQIVLHAPPIPWTGEAFR